MLQDLKEWILLIRAFPHMWRINWRRINQRLEVVWFDGVPDDVVHLIALYDPEESEGDWLILAARREQARRFPEWSGRPASTATRRCP
jgi:hypothetical protein